MKSKQSLIIMFIAIAMVVMASCSLFSSSKLYPVLSNEKWGYVDCKGNYVIHPQFEMATPFVDGIAMVLNNGKIGYINTKGKYVVNAKYAHGTMFSEGYAFVVTDNSYPICINSKGEEVFTLKVAKQIFSFHDGLALFVDDQGKHGYVNTKGQIIIPAQFCNAQITFSEGLAAVQKEENGQWGVIDKTGKLVIPYQFDEVDPFFDGFAAFKNGNQWGYINTKGKYAINPQFDEAYTFSERLASFGNGDQKGVVNTKGEYAINPQYDDIYPFTDGLAAFLSGNQWGFINKKEEIVINPQFDNVIPFEGNHAIVEYNGLFGVIDKKGKYTINPQYEAILPIMENELIRYIFDSIGLGYVSSTYYDADKVINQLFKENSLLNKITKFKTGTTLKNVKNTAPFGSLNIDDRYNLHYSNKKAKSDSDVSIKKVLFSFNESIYENSYSYYYDYYYSRTYNWKSKVKAIQCNFRLSGDAIGKASVIANALRKKFESINGTKFKAKDGLYFGCNEEEGCGYVISYSGENEKNNELTFILFLQKKEYNKFIGKVGYDDNDVDGELTYEEVETETLEGIRMEEVGSGVI